MKKIFTKKAMEDKTQLPVVSFNEEHKAIEICGDNCHFLLSPLPSMKGTFGTAQWAVKRAPGWKLPSEHEISVLNDYLEEINTTLLANDYPPIDDKDRWWIDQYHIADSLIDVSWAMMCPLGWRHVAKRKIDEACEFRLIKPLLPCQEE